MDRLLVFVSNPLILHSQFKKNSCSFNVLSPSNRKPCFRYTAVALSALSLIISHTRYISQLVYHSVTVCRGWCISIILYSRLKVSKGPPYQSHGTA